jgi:uncharacterized protein YgbK (DUF1537 family)
MGSVRLHVAADDRTGALEVAAALADRGAGGDGGVPVTVWPGESSAPVAVIDLATRHLDPAAAAGRAAELPSVGALAHKIDSTLRGNWAVELVARHGAIGRAVLVVAALPAQGRTCLGGIVYEYGIPVHEGSAGRDLRQGVLISRPLEHLRSAGAHEIVELGAVDDVIAWLAAPSGFAVADAIDDADVAALASAWAAVDGVLLGATSAVIGATAGPVSVISHPPTTGPVLVVNGSPHAIARAQVEAAAAHGAVIIDDGDIGAAVQALRGQRPAIVTAGTPSDTVAVHDAHAMATLLAARAHAIAEAVPELAALVVIGGDTAAAVLGDLDVTVFGSVRPGTAWVESPRFSAPVITRAGGFGDSEALVDLIWGALQ